MIPRRREMIMKLTIINFEREHAAATRVQTMVRVKQGKQTRFLLERMFQTMMPQSSNDRMLLKVRSLNNFLYSVCRKYVKKRLY